MGGTKLIRGYREVEAKEKKEAETKDDKESNKYEDAIKEKSRQMASDTVGKISAEKRKEMDDIEMTKRQAEDYENEDSEELRDIDQVVFVIHG